MTRRAVPRINATDKLAPPRLVLKSGLDSDLFNVGVVKPVSDCTFVSEWRWRRCDVAGGGIHMTHI